MDLQQNQAYLSYLTEYWLSEQHVWYHSRKGNEEKEMGIAEKTLSLLTENLLHS